MPFCDKCGQEVNETATFCEKCGKAIGEPGLPNPTQVVQAKAKGKNRFIKIGAIVVLFIALAGGIAAGGVFWYKAAHNTTEKVADAIRAKEIRSTAVKTIELYATDNDGSYERADAARLSQLETSIYFEDFDGLVNHALIVSTSVNGYVIMVRGRDGINYTATKEAGGAVVYEEKYD